MEHGGSEAGVDAEENYCMITVLKKGKAIPYTVPSFPVLTALLREATFQWQEEDGIVQVVDGFIRECELVKHHPLPAIAKVVWGYKNGFAVDVEEFSRSIDTSNYKIHRDNIIFIIWKWTWMQQDSEIDTDDSDKGEVTSVHSLGSDNGSEVSSVHSLGPNNSDCDDDGLQMIKTGPPIVHSVVFKCMGCIKEDRYQEILIQVSKRMKENEKVPVQLQKEPNNPVDSRAIAFVCKLNSQWERIGYVASEALDSVHQALRDDHIIDVRFEWVKYIVYFRNRGWYAGITIEKKSEWPQSVLRCSAKSFH